MKLRRTTPGAAGRAMLLVVMAAVTACGSTTEGPPVVMLDEFSIDTRGDLGGGPWEVANRGEFGHTLLVTDEAGRVVASTEVLAAGESTTIATGLAPGDYRLTCRIVVEAPGGEIVDHYARGMDRQVSLP